MIYLSTIHHFAALRQGNCILWDQDFIEIIHVPAGTFAFGGDTRLDRGFLAQQIEGAPAPGALRARHILRAVATANAAAVLPEADIQDPMQAGGGP